MLLLLMNFAFDFICFQDDLFNLFIFIMHLVFAWSLQNVVGIYIVLCTPTCCGIMHKPNSVCC